jgi:MOSC domain-containing protein
MNTGVSADHLADVWRFPVKSMAGERLDEVALTPQGVLGDRGLALLDLEADAVVSASNKHFPGLMDWRATYVQPPRISAELPAVRITHPTGITWTTDDPAISSRLSAYFRRDVLLVRERSTTYASKQAAFFEGIGLPDLAPTTTLVDLGPVSVISTATFAELSRAQPRSRFEAPRFRMNLIVKSTTEGFVDNSWVGGHLSIGDQVRLQVALPDPRCSMTTLAQGDLEKDPGILRTIAEMNSFPVGSGAPQPCAGVYAMVVHPGVVRRGDRVVVSPV